MRRHPEAWHGPQRPVREMARPAGFEPATTRLEGGCSIQLSYGRVRKAAGSANSAVCAGCKAR